MPTKPYDFLVIGQGLAGSILAHQLNKAGSSVMIIDNEHTGCASKVAGGVINAITGHRLNITETFNTYYPSARDYYQSLEQELDTTLWQAITQTRLIKNQGQYEYLQKRLKDPDYKNIISSATPHKLFSHHHDDTTNFGTITVANTALVDAKRLLQCVQQLFTEQSAYTTTKLDYQQLKFSNQGVNYQHITARKVIFCEGFQAINNPWLRDLPFKLSKGDVLRVRVDKSVDSLLNWGHWLLPETQTDTAKLGSSYEWNTTSLAPSSVIKEKLLKSLATHTELNADVLAHESGIRPTTKYRQPFIGAIPKLPYSYCFNGFGSKGCLLIPYYANLIVEHLTSQQPLPERLTLHL